jgi:ribosomal protein L11 methyltransferase
MAWIELSLESTWEAVDWVRSLLAAHQIQAEIRVTPHATLGTTPENAEPLKPSADEGFPLHLSVWLPDQPGGRQQVDEIAQILAPLHRTGMTTELAIATLSHQPEASNQVAIAQHRVGTRLVIVTGAQPSELQDKAKLGLNGNDIAIYLPDSQAFGSGLHPTTRLSLGLLEQHITPGIVALDLGSGSGVLAVAMAKLGAIVTALDNDPMAVEATQAAIAQNGLTAQVTARAGSLGVGTTMGHWMGGAVSEAMEGIDAIAPDAQFALIMANIPARVNIALAESFAQALQGSSYPRKSTKTLITAGYTIDYEEDVNAAMVGAGFSPTHRTQQGEWVALVHQFEV